MLVSVSASKLNVRTVPALTSSVLGVLHFGKVIDVDDTSGAWAEIHFRNRQAYVASSYLEPISPLRVWGIVNAGPLNVRSQPSVTSEITGSLSRGVSVNVLAQLPGWLEIEFNQHLGYLAAAYVDLYAKEKAYSAQVTARILNVRSEPSKSSRILGRLMSGEKLEVKGGLDQWAEIVFSGNTAYVAKRYLQFCDLESARPRAETHLETDSDPAFAPASSNDLDDLMPAQQLPVSGDSTRRKVINTWNLYGAELLRSSQALQLDVACAVAVLCVESSGKGFEQNNQNRMIIRFENHRFWRYWGQYHGDQFRAHFQYKQGKAWLGHRWRAHPNEQWQSFHGNQTKEWQVFEFSKNLNAEAAMLSISMGAPQIMGFNYERIGYAQAADMFEDFSSSMAAHIRGLFAFLDEPMINALKRLDFERFAGRYNGAGQKQQYGAWISEHYQSFKEATRGVTLS